VSGDLLDQAQILEEAEREAAMAEQLAKTRRVHPADWDRAGAKWCEGAHCGVRIPDARRRAVPGVKLCAECQGRVERGFR
jgi:phage/conjugal plasmid C-4 type zinc finger TraR family protein